MDLAQQSDAAIWRIVNPIMDNLMEASTAIDYARHVRDFTPRARSMLNEEGFRSLCECYQAARGCFAEREPVALFRRPESVAAIRRQRFTRQPGDFVAEMVLVQSGDRYLVDHVLVF